MRGAFFDKPYSKKVFSTNASSRCNPSPDRACPSCALKLETTYDPCSLQMLCFLPFPKTSPRRFLHPFSFKRLASSLRARASSPSPSVHAQHDNWHDHPPAYPLESHCNVNTRVGTHHPTLTSTIRAKTNDIAAFQLSLSLTFHASTRLYSLYHTFSNPPDPFSFARVTALQAAFNSSKKWLLMPSLNEHTLP